mmetsp:Transcript_6332/g.10688  ORF Transcript_6332/g.10688 Transcript_6332/m.10688 type:complete len:725 (+) Transcript_6332:1-2175(+)
MSKCFTVIMVWVALSVTLHAILSTAVADLGSGLIDALHEEDASGDWCSLLQVSSRPQTQPASVSNWVLVSGNEKRIMERDPYYDLLKANKEWASESLGMRFQHYWSEEVLPKDVNKKFAKIFMVQKAMSDHPDADFFLFMDSYNTWFNPKLLFKQNGGALLQDIASAIPEDKHFILAPVRPLSTGVFVVRNSEIGAEIINSWVAAASSPDAPRCHPWDSAALGQVLVRMVSKEKNLTPTSYSCQASCQQMCGSFDDVYRQWGMEEFPAGLANDRMPIFHVLTASRKGRSGIPRLMCLGCLTYNRPTASTTADITQTIITSGEDRLYLDIPWLINSAGDIRGTTIMPDTFGLLECRQSPPRSKVAAMIIGTPFGGSKSIQRYLSPHPLMILPQADEINFFNTGKRKGNVWKTIQKAVAKSRAENSGAHGFRQEMDTVCRDYLERFPMLEGMFTVDTSPDLYLNFHAAEWIRYLFPDMKLIFSLRDPSARAYAEWQAFKGTDATDGKVQGRVAFSEFLDARLHTVEPCMHSWNAGRILQDQLYPPFAQCVNISSPEQEISRGLYLAHLVPWMSEFPRKNIHFVDFDDLQRDSAAMLAQVGDFIGLNEVDWTVSALQLELDAQDDDILLANEAVNGIPESCKFYALENERLATMVNMSLNWCGANDQWRKPIALSDKFEQRKDRQTTEQFMCRGLTPLGCETLYRKLRAYGWVDEPPSAAGRRVIGR